MDCVPYITGMNGLTKDDGATTSKTQLDGKTRKKKSKLCQ